MTTPTPTLLLLAEEAARASDNGTRHGSPTPAVLAWHTTRLEAVARLCRLEQFAHPDPTERARYGRAALDLEARAADLRHRRTPAA